MTVEVPERSVALAENDVSLPPPYHEFWYSDDSEALQARRTEAVTPRSVQKIATAFACVDVLSKTHAMLPAGVFQKSSAGRRELLKNHPVLRVLRRPNAVMDRFQFWQLKERCQLLRGNFYAQKMLNKYDQLVALHPIHPDCVTVRPRKGAWDIEYVIHDVSGERVLSREEMFHTKEPGEDGLVGRSRIHIAYDAFRLALAHQAQNQSLAENDSRPVGLLIPGAPIRDEEQKNKLRSTWEETHRGPRNAGRVAVVPHGFTYEQLSMTAKDAEALDWMIFAAVDQINAIFDVPPYRTQDFRRATFGNVEHADIFWAKNSIQPRVICTECAIDHQLLSDDDIVGDVFVKFNLDAMFRADIKTRSEAYRNAIQDGWLTRAEVRELEDWNPLPGHGLEEPLAPMNYTTARGLMNSATKEPESKPAEEPKQIEAPPVEEDDEEEKLSAKRTREIALERLLSEPLTRLATKEKRALIKCLKKAKWHDDAVLFNAKHREHMRETLGASIHAFFGEAVNSGDLDAQIESVIDAHFDKRADEMTQALSNGGRDALIPLFETWDQPESIKSTVEFIAKGVGSYE